MVAFKYLIALIVLINTENSTFNTLGLLGQRIAQERLRQNLTQLALSRRSGVAYSTLRKIEAKGMGAMGDYADILAALGQLEQLAAWAVAGSFEVKPNDAPGPPKLRKRARTQSIGASTNLTDAAKDAGQPTATGTQPPSAGLPIALPRSTPALRASERLGLDFPYDWSNPAMGDTALIGAVLGRARFMDVSKIFAHFGAARVEQVATELAIDLHAGVLGALMPGIQQGAQRVSNA